MIRARLPAALTCSLVVLLGACSTPAASPRPEPDETEAAATHAVETDAPTTEAPEESEEAEETDDGSATREFSYEALVRRIPEDTAEHCEEHPDSSFRLITAECAPPAGSGADYIAYALGSSEEEYADYYGRLVDNVGITERNQGSCPEDVPSEEAYSTEEEEVGLLACALDEAGTAILVWTDDRLLIVSYAARVDGDIEALYEWWSGPDSGPLQ